MASGRLILRCGTPGILLWWAWGGHGGRVMERHRLTDAQWNCIADVFPPPAKTGLRPQVAA